MTREEAIKIVQSATVWTDEERDALAMLIPELAESEDEKNWKAVKEYIKDDALRSWLEKQKETGIRWLKSDNVKNPDKPYIDKAGMFYTTDGRMCYVSEIEKQKEDEGCEATPVESTLEYKLGFKAGKESEKQKEQQPMEKHDMVAQLREHLANTPKEQLEAEWKELEKWNHVGPTVEEYLGGIKPSEWSDEDKEMLGKVLECIRFAEDRYQLELEGTNGISVKSPSL